MCSRKLIALFIFIICVSKCTIAQQKITVEEADIKSYALYEKADWKNLLQFGKAYITSKQPDFVLLRLRLGYAAFMLHNFSQALQQYQAAIQQDATNETAHYYSWLCRKYLNQFELATVHEKYFTDVLKTKEKLTNIFAFTQVGVEASYKATELLQRGDGLYTRLDVKTKLLRNIHMYHAAALYNQTISETKLTAVNNNNSIAINQKEYYNKTIVNLHAQWQLIVAYHYLYTPFNNYVYNNHIGLLGFKYNHYYYSLQADAIVGRLTDTAMQQYNATLTVFPLGNLNLYSISTAAYSSRNKTSAINFKQVIGAKILPFLWLEGNITLGEFKNFFENDALYVYNAIDKNNIKAGATTYITLSPTIILQLGYTFENRTTFNTTNTFNQHSITGGLSCKF